ncbi:MAG: MarR family transcriptional regulator [Mycobacterium sp.]|uniref:MarR family winged helix-turn-helix transcriptional regulator n=1 Tax=Mycobacterium sp. TaxID=1785 RepID=UPI003BB03AC5
MVRERGTDHIDDVGVLLSQLGYHATALIAEQLSPIGLAPAHAGMMRAIAAQPGQSQQTLAANLGVAASRLVGYIDYLEKRGYVERRRRHADRRVYALHLTEAGEELMGRISELFHQRESRLLSELEPEERDKLCDLLARLAQQEGLRPLAHPAYRNLGGTTSFG